MNKWTEEEILLLKENYNSKTITEISKIINRTESAIMVRASQLQLTRPHIGWAEYEDEILRQFYCKMNFDVVQALLSPRTKVAIQKRAGKLGLTKPGYYLSLANRKYIYDESFFNKPGVINSYYAGFIAADGCINDKYHQVKIALCSKDRFALDNFKDFTNYNNSVKIYQRIDEDGIERETAMLYYNFAYRWIEDLEKNWNIKGENKTEKLEPPLEISQNNMISYMVGLIDGDGSIWNQNKNYLYLEFSGNISMVTWFRGQFCLLTNNTNPPKITQDQKDNQICHKVKFSRKWLLKFYGLVEPLNIDWKFNRKWGLVQSYLQQN